MDKRLLLTLLMLLISTTGTLTVVLTLLWSMPDLPETVSDSRMCLPVIPETGVSSYIQCGHTADRLHSYIQQRISYENKKLEEEEKRKNEEAASERPIAFKRLLQEIYWEIKPSARFTGVKITPRPNDYGKELVPIREWKHGRRLHDNGGFRLYGIRLVNGRIVVPVTGTYQIYSFLDMYEPCIPGTGIPDIENRNQSITHSIFKFNILDGFETELISSLQPHLKSSNLYFNIYSSFVSSVFQLNVGDEVIVKVSNITYLKYPELNYFGINMI